MCEQQIESFESKMTKMTSQLDAQYELSRAADRRARRAEQDLMDLQQQLTANDTGSQQHDHVRPLSLSVSLCLARSTIS